MMRPVRMYEFHITPPDSMEPEPVHQQHTCLLAKILEKREGILESVLSVLKPFLESVEKADILLHEHDPFDPMKEDHDAYTAYLSDLTHFYGTRIPLGDKLMYLRESDHRYFVRHNGPDSQFIHTLFQGVTSIYPLLKKSTFDDYAEISIDDVYASLKLYKKLGSEGCPRTGRKMMGKKFMMAGNVASTLPESLQLEPDMIEKVANIQTETGLMDVRSAFVIAQWDNLRDEGTLYHAVLERLLKGLPLNAVQQERLDTNTGHQLQSFVREITGMGYKFYQGETAVTSHLSQDPAMWCMRATGCIDLVFLSPNQPKDGKVHVVIGDLKCSYWTKNNKYGDTVIDEYYELFLKSGKKSLSNHEWHQFQVDFYHVLYEEMYPNHVVDGRFLVYVDQGLNALDHQRTQKAPRDTENYHIEWVEHNPVRIAYLQWKRLLKLYELSLRDNLRLTEYMNTCSRLNADDLAKIQSKPKASDALVYAELYEAQEFGKMAFKEYLRDHESPPTPPPEPAKKTPPPPPTKKQKTVKAFKAEPVPLKQPTSLFRRVMDLL